MCSKSQPTFDLNSAKQNFLNQNEYDVQGILNIIRRYYELRSAAEITAVQYGHVSGSGGLAHGKDDIMCILADIDQGVIALSARQMAVVKLLKMGYLIKEISEALGIRQVTVKLHIRQAGLRLAAYFNTLKIGER